MKNSSKGKGTRFFGEVVGLMSAVVVAGSLTPAMATAAKGSASPIITTIATGLHNPRGLKFGPDGHLYVAEGGIGGDALPPADCQPTVPPQSGIAPYMGSNVGSQISRIESDGSVTTWVGGLPSSQTAGPEFVSGVADIAFVGNTMYFVLAGAGCTHGVPSTPNLVGRVDDAVNADGTHTWTQIADLSAFAHAHLLPGGLDDEEPDGTWYSMIAVGGDLYTVEPNRGMVVKVTTSGGISPVIDIHAHYGHIVPTALAYHGNFYIGNLNEFGIPSGSSNVYKFTPSGQIKVDTPAFTTVVGVVFDSRARMYVLENMTASEGPLLFTTPGRITRVDPSGHKEVIVAGDPLRFPTAMTIGPDGNLYVSNHGFALGDPESESGEILKIQIQ
jgi:hypothetical protein